MFSGECLIFYWKRSAGCQSHFMAGDQYYRDGKTRGV